MDGNKVWKMLNDNTIKDYAVSFIEKRKLCDLTLCTESISSNQKTHSKTNEKRRQIYIIRHGERVDFIFGKNWPMASFDQTNQSYIRRDLNMPATLPFCRTNEDWQNDSPITSIGEHHAYLTGQAMRIKGIEISHVYSSPALRTIQTSQAWLKGYNGNDDLKIRIEPGFFQLPTSEGVGNWLSINELCAVGGCKIDIDYTPIIKRDDLLPWINKPGVEEHYERVNETMKKIIEKNEHGNILIFGHSDSYELLSQVLIDGKINLAAYIEKIFGAEYCGVLSMEEIKKDKWMIIDPPIPSSTWSQLKRFKWSQYKL